MGWLGPAGASQIFGPGGASKGAAPPNPGGWRGILHAMGIALRGGQPVAVQPPTEGGSNGRRPLFILREELPLEDELLELAVAELLLAELDDYGL